MMKKDILSAIVAILVCFYCLPVWSGSVNCYPNSSYRWTGSVKNNSGSYIDVDGPETVVVADPSNDYPHRAFLKFNISSIPDNAIITQVTLYVYVRNASASANNFDIHPLSNNPTSVGGSTLWNDIGAVETLYYNDWTGLNSGATYKSVILEGNVNSDLQSKLSSDWFAVGIYEEGDDADEAYIGGYAWTNPPYINVVYNVYSPTLSDGYVDPTSGYYDTQFYYYVKYTDADDNAPTYVKVYIDGSEYTMSFYSGGSYTSGVWYRYGPITLNRNAHNYYFKTSDGYFTYTTSTYSGPSVNNRNPVISSPSLSPSSGDTTTNFIYQINYYDEDADVPSTKYVYISGTPYTMTLYSGSASNGTYRYQITFNNYDSKSYYFYFADAYSGSDREPSSGTVSGPIVHSYGTLSNADVIPTSGNIETEFELKVTYTDADGDNPTIKNVKIDGTPYVMSYVSGSSSTGAVYSYKTKLSRSSHTYSFAFAEPDTANITTASFSGPTVQNRKPVLSSPTLSEKRSDTPRNIVFGIIYSDSDNDSPDSPLVIVSQTTALGQTIKSDTYVMAYINGSYNSGAQYTCDTIVMVGYHKYKFYFIDNYGSDTSTDWFDGPTVGSADYEVVADVPTPSEVVQGGQSSIYKIRTITYAGFAEAVDISVAMPTNVSGLNYTLSKTQISSNDMCDLIIRADDKAEPIGTYKIIVTGNFAGMQPRSDEAPITLKYKSEISVKSSASKINKGDKVSITGTLNPAMSVPAKFIYYWKGEPRHYQNNQEKNDKTKEQSVSIDASGNFRDEFSSDKIGKWEVVVEWDGNDMYGGDSGTVSFIVSTEDIQEAKAGPIPANPEKGDVVRFFNVPSKSEVRIYTLSGKLVKILSEGSGDINVNESVATWNGKNTDNEMIASGIYYYMIAKDNKPLFDKPKKIVIIKK